MLAKFTGNKENARNMAPEKETVSKYLVIGKVDGREKEIVDARVYMGRSSSSSTVYASIWVRGANGLYTTGRGTAGGYGYHKESAAIAGAISSAGIELYGQPYADEKGYFYGTVKNPAWRPFEERTPEEQENKNYGWTVPEYIRIKRKENAKELKNRAHIDGIGSEAVKVALLAIAKAAGGCGRLLFVQM